MRKSFFVIMLLSAFIGGNIYISYADLQKDNPIVLDGKQYSKKDLIKAFMEASFAKKVWPIDDGKDASFQNETTQEISEEENTLRIFPRPKGESLNLFLQAYPWLEEFLSNDRSYSYREKLYKWNSKNIQVSFDWPIYSERPHDRKDIPYVCGHATQNCSFVKEIVSGQHKDIVRHVQSISRQLSDLSNIQVSLVMPGASTESSKDFARIRIIFDSINEQKNYFKFHRFGVGVQQIDWRIRNKEYELKPAISFTTDTRSQVDGFLVLNAEESIGLAVCKIMPEVGDKMIKALITECLVRAMGFTDTLHGNNNSVLSNWNAAYDKISFLKDIDGRSLAIKQRRERHNKSEMLVLNNDPPRFDFLNEYDNFMLKLMYCDEIKSGSLRQDVGKSLSSCFDKFSMAEEFKSDQE